MQKRLLTILGLSATFFLIGCADDQARQQIADTNARLNKIQDNVSVLGTKVSNQKLLDILNKLDDLQNQINELNGNVDTLKHNQQAYQSNQDQINQSLQQQIQGTSKAAPDSTATAATISATDANKTNDDAESLKAALKKVKAQNYPDAIKDLKNIAKNADDQEVVANATYYLAVAYAANKQYKDSMVTARKFIKDNPEHNKVPDAMRTIYIDQLELGMKKSANQTATLLIKKYPKSDAAKKVQQTLGE